MRIYLAITFGIALGWAGLAAGAPGAADSLPVFRLCYFSLNNQTEIKAARELAREFPGATGKLVVTEELPYGEYPDEGFLAMIGRARCDGLVLSGHHRTQGFEGIRVPGYLPTEKLEAWSCGDEHVNWFRSVKAVWLQGCATSGREAGSESRLIERYARVFPEAAIFSWSGSAPSRMAPRTLPYHARNLAKLAGAGIDPAEALIQIVRGKAGANGLEAWRKLRRAGDKEFQGIYNRSAQAFAPYSIRRAGEAGEHREARCALQRDSYASERLAGVRANLASAELLLENADALRAELRRARAYPEYETRLRAELKLRLPHTLRTALASGNRAGSLAERFLAYRLYSEAGLERSVRLEAQLAEALANELARARRGNDAVELKHFYDSIFLAALPDLPGGGSLVSLRTLEQAVSNDAIQAALRALISSRAANAGAFLAALARNPHADSESLYQVALQLRLHRKEARLTVAASILARGNVSAKTRQLLTGMQL